VKKVKNILWFCSLPFGPGPTERDNAMSLPQDRPAAKLTPVQNKSRPEPAKK